MSEDESGTRGGLSEEDFARFEAIVERHAKASADVISRAMMRSAPKPSSPWVVAATIAGVTATIIASMAYLVGIGDEKQTALLASIKDSVNKNTSAINGLTEDVHQLDLTFATLNGSVNNLNKSLVHFKGPPVGNRYWIAPSDSRSD